MLNTKIGWKESPSKIRDTGANIKAKETIIPPMI